MSAVEVVLREAASQDATTLALVGASTFLESFAGVLPAESILWHCGLNHSEAAYANYLAQPTTRAWLVEAAQGLAPVGYALVTAPDFAPELIQPGDAELRRIYVFSRFHGSGAGQQMMQAAIAYARNSGYKRLLLGVYRLNTRALAFYARNGFVTVNVRTFTLGNSTFDDLVLGLEL